MGGFVRNNRKQEWNPPRLTVFRSEDEAWAHYSRKALKELAALEKLMERQPPSPEERNIRRRA